MRRHGARWAHAARVATGATVVVAAVALVVALVVNAYVADHLVHDVDARLAALRHSSTIGEGVRVSCLSDGSPSGGAAYSSVIPISG